MTGQSEPSIYRPRWRPDANGFVAGFAGKWAGRKTADLDELREVVRQMPNGHQIEIVTVNRCGDDTCTEEHGV